MQPVRNVIILVLLTLTLPLSVRAEEIASNPNNASETVLTAPLNTGTNNLLHALILIPPLESARLLPPDTGYFSAGLDYAAGNFRADDGTWLLDYDAHLAKGFVRMQYGLAEGCELSATLTDGELFQNNRELLLLNGNTGYFSGTRGRGLSDLVVGVKYRLDQSASDEIIPYTDTLALWVKYPLADKENILSSGGTDWAIAYIETARISENTFTHLQIGYTYTGGATVFREPLTIDKPIFYGAGVSWRATEHLALIGQLQGNTNAFREIRVLKQNPVSLQGGYRYQEADSRFFTEAAVGWGLNDASADFTMMFRLGTIF